MNTLLLKDLLSPRVIESLRNPVTAKAYCTMEGDFTRATGDTVAFSIFPEYEAQVGGVAGSEQTPRDFALTETSMTLDKRVHDLYRLTNWEKYLQNFDLQAKLAAMMARGLERKQEDYIFDTMIDNAGTAINASGSPATESASTIYGSILQFKEVLTFKGQNTNGEGEIVVFVPSSIAKLIQQSDIFDATEAGLKGRINGIIGTMLGGNIHIVVSDRMPRNDAVVNGVADETYMLGMRRWAVSYANGIFDMWIDKIPNANAHYLGYENVFGVDVLGTPNADQIVKKHVSNLTATTIFQPTL